MQQKDCCADSY